MSDLQRSSSTDSGIDRLTSAARAHDKVQTGLKLVETVLKLGESAGLPLIPAVCSAARGVLQVVQASRTVINDALSAAQRTIDVLELLQLMAKNVERMDVTSRASVEDRMRELQRLLEDVRSAVAAFGKKGWLRHALKVKRRNAFSQLDSEITGQLDLLLTFYKIARDAHIIDRLQAREYAVEAEVERQVAERNAIGQAVDADALEKDSEVVRSIAVASGVSDAEFRSELLELGDEVRKRFEKVEQVLEQVLDVLSTNTPAQPPPPPHPPQPVPIPRLLAVGCASFTAPAKLSLDGVLTELDEIQAALPASWVAASVLRDPTAEQAASEASSLPGFSWFHFSGHADPTLGSHRTLLWIKNGRPEAIDAPSLVQMLRRAELVVLNGCKSLALAEALAHAGVPNVVSWETLTPDDASSRFGVAFWKRVAEETQAGVPLRDAARLAFFSGELAVRSATTAGSLANGALPAFTPRFALGIDPQDAALVKQAAPGRGRCLPAAGPDAVGRIAAGRPVLLQPQRPCGDLPAIPDHYKERPADAALRERLIKDGLQSVSLLGRGCGGAATLAGTAGLGKSTLAAVLARDVRVQSAFHDGIFWLRFGQERSALDVLRELAGMIDVDISALREQQAAVIDAIARWLDTRRCLLILDDVWTPEQAKPFTRLHAGRLLTTRVREVATRAGGRTQEIGALERRQALRLLAACMQTDADLSTDADAKELVRLSGGLPVVLEQWGAVCRDQSMGSFLEELRRARGQNTFVDVEGGGDYEYDTFFAGMEVQLLRLEVNDAQIERCCCRLAVLPEDTEMPLSVAAMLWGVDDVDAAKIARKLEGQNLAKRTEAGGRTEASLSLLDLHLRTEASLSLLDLHLQYLRHRGRNAIAVWHAALLRGWMEGCVGGVLKPVGYWRRGGVLKHHLGGTGSVLLPESLTELNINGSIVGKEGAKALASALEGNAVLTTLDLSGNDIRDEGAVAIAEVLRVNGVMTNLNLNSNNIRDEGAKAIGEALRVNGVVTELDISWNQIGPTGATAIADALRVNGVLTSLNLSANEICGIDEDGDGEYVASGIVALADALKANGVLTELRFGGIEIGDEGAAALASALRVNGVLKRIVLYNNELGDEGEKAIRDAVSEREGFELMM